MQKYYGEKQEHIDIKDIFQIAAGTLAAAIVFAPNQYLINLAIELPFFKVFIIFLLSISISGIIAYKIGARKINFEEMQKIGDIIPLRIVAIYVIAAFSCLLVLWLYNIITINTEFRIIVKEVVVLSLIACGSGTMFDLAYSKNK